MVDHTVEIPPFQLWLVFVVICIVAIYCFVNGYYGMRFPERYFKASWTAKRGLKGDPYYAKGYGALGLLIGAILAGMSCMVLQGILAD
jgi:hypothetical protein